MTEYDDQINRKHRKKVGDHKGLDNFTNQLKIKISIFFSFDSYKKSAPPPLQPPRPFGRHLG